MPRFNDSACPSRYFAKKPDGFASCRKSWKLIEGNLQAVIMLMIFNNYLLSIQEFLKFHRWKAMQRKRKAVRHSWVLITPFYFLLFEYGFSFFNLELRATLHSFYFLFHCHVTRFNDLGEKSLMFVGFIVGKDLILVTTFHLRSI